MHNSMTLHGNAGPPRQTSLHDMGPPILVSSNAVTTTQHPDINVNWLTFDYQSLPARPSPPDMGVFGVDPDFERHLWAAYRLSLLRDTWRDRKYGEEAKTSRRGWTPSPVRRAYAEKQKEWERRAELSSPSTGSGSPVASAAEKTFPLLPNDHPDLVAHPQYKTSPPHGWTLPSVAERTHCLYRMPRMVDENETHYSEEELVELKKEWKARDLWDRWHQGTIDKMLFGISRGPRYEFEREPDEGIPHHRVASDKSLHKCSDNPNVQQATEAGGPDTNPSYRGADPAGPPAICSKGKDFLEIRESTSPSDRSLSLASSCTSMSLPTTKSATVTGCSSQATGKAEMMQFQTTPKRRRSFERNALPRGESADRAEYLPARGSLKRRRS